MGWLEDTLRGGLALVMMVVVGVVGFFFIVGGFLGALLAQDARLYLVSLFGVFIIGAGLVLSRKIGGGG